MPNLFQRAENFRKRVFNSSNDSKALSNSQTTTNSANDIKKEVAGLTPIEAPNVVSFEKPALSSEKASKTQNQHHSTVEETDPISDWGVWWGIDLGYHWSATKEYLGNLYDRFYPWPTEEVDVAVQKKQLKEQQYLHKMDRAKLDHKKIVRQKFNNDLKFFRNKRTISQNWFENTEKFLILKRERDENLIPPYNSYTDKFDSLVIEENDRVARLNELCNDLKCCLGESNENKLLGLSNGLNSNSDELNNIDCTDELLAAQTLWENKIINERATWNEKLEKTQENFKILEKQCIETSQRNQHKINQYSENIFENSKRIVDLKTDIQQCETNLNQADLKYRELEENYQNLLKTQNVNDSVESPNIVENNEPTGAAHIVDSNWTTVGVALNFLENTIKFPIRVALGEFPKSNHRRLGLGNLTLPIIRAILAALILYIYYLMVKVLYDMIATMLHNFKKEQVTHNIVVTDNKKRKFVKQDNIEESEEWQKYENTKKKKNILNKIISKFKSKKESVLNVRGGYLSQFSQEIILTSISPELYLVKLIKKRLELESLLFNRKTVKAQSSAFKFGSQFKATILGLVLFSFSAPYNFMGPRKFYESSSNNYEYREATEDKALSSIQVETNSRIEGEDFHKQESGVKEPVVNQKKKRKQRKKAKLVRLSDLPPISENVSTLEAYESNTILSSPNSKLKIKIGSRS